MQTLNLIVSLPSALTRLTCEVSANEDRCDVVVEFARGARRDPRVEPMTTCVPHRGDDDYVLGGYAGI